MRDGASNFRYLNRDGRWRDFSRQRLRLRSDGSLQLAPVPRLDGPLPDGLDQAPAPDGLSGIAIDWDESVYLTDTAGNRILRRDGCSGITMSAACMSAAVMSVGGLDHPRGLTILPRRRALVVVDSGNNRVVLFDIASGQVVSIWGGPGSQPGRFTTPLTAGVDSDGNVYVLDYGNRRVQRFLVDGSVDTSFADAIGQTGLVPHPADLAVYSSESETWIYVRDADSNDILIFDSRGNPWLDSRGAPLRVNVQSIAAPMGMAATADAIYIGDNAARTVVKFAWTGESFELAGPALEYHGPVAALALDARGKLFVHTGGASYVSLSLDAAYCREGLLWSRALSFIPDRVDWFRLSTIGPALPAGAHLQYFTRTSDQPQDPPVHPSSDDPFPATHWQRQLPDVTDFYLGGAPARYLWIGARFSSDGLSSPLVSQLRVEFNHCGYEEYLPAIYRSGSACGDFLVRFLGLFESFFAEQERSIAHLADLFDPSVVPDAAIRWLAEWLAVTLDEDDDLAAERRAIAEAFSSYATRGTVAGLRASLLRHAHVNAVIQEPILQSSWWALPSSSGGCACGGGREPEWTGGEDSVLGFSTVLAAAYPQGAVLGTTAVLDQSHLAAGDEFAAALFEDVAHQFTVRVYRGEVRDEAARARVEAVLAREKPAHTLHHLCFVEPRMRVGFQARLGIDTVVAGGPAATELGQSPGAIVLAGEPAGRIGQQSTVGTTTRL